MCFKSFLLLVKRKVKDNNTKKTKDVEACVYIIYSLHNLEYELGLQSGRIFSLCKIVEELGGILLSW